MIDPVQNIVQNPKLRRGFFLAAVAMQLACGLVFTLDIISEWGEFTWHTWAEILGVVVLQRKRSLPMIGAISIFTRFTNASPSGFSSTPQAGFM